MWFSEAIQDKITIAGAYFNWMPSWWYRNYGIGYGERMVFDPDYRVDAYLAMRRIVHERYHAASLGTPDPQPCVVAPDWGNAQGPAGTGDPGAPARVRYPIDNYPVSYHLTREEIDRLRVPDDVTTTWPFCESIRQVRYLNRRLELDAPPVLNARGVLNEACLIQGDAALADLYAEPERSRRLLGYTHGLIHALLRHNQHVAPQNSHMLFNCAEIMVGPHTYEELLLNYDLATSALCAQLGVGLSLHHCGRFDHFAPLYRRLGPMVLIEIGSESNVRLALDMFPEAKIQYIMPTALMCQGTRAQVGERIDALLEAGRGDWHRLYLSVADLEFGMPDDNLFEVYEHLRRAA